MTREYNLIEYSNGTYISRKIKFTPPSKILQQIEEERKIEENRKAYAEFERQARVTNPQDEGENGKYKVLKVGNTQVFNADILNKNIGYCFYFEGKIDALSGIECGFNAR